MTGPRRLPGPYGRAARRYLAAGWGSPLPLPPGRKKPPPDGWTGYDGRQASAADVEAWCEEHPGGNIGMRVRSGVIGIDGDAHKGPAALAAWRKLADEFGPLPAAPWCTSRDDGISGIRLFTVPDGYTAVTVMGPAGEVIQRHHRYVVVPPSVSPPPPLGTGKPYCWTGRPDGYVPAMSDIPPLPQTWLDGLRGGGNGQRAGPGFQQPGTSTTGWTSPDVGTLVTGGIPEGANQDDHLRDLVFECVRQGMSSPAVRAVWDAAVARTPLLRPGEPWTGGDFQRHYRGAVQKAAAGAPGGQAPDPDGDLAARLAWEHRKAVEQHKSYLRARQEAEAELLSEGSKPAPDPVRLDALLAEPDEPAAYRIDRLWPAGGRVILSAQRKAGKTTTMANLLRSLADGSPFLGCYQVTAIPGTGTVFAIDTEMSRGMLRQWYRDQRIGHPERIHVEPLRGAVSSFNLLDAGRRGWWARALRERQAAVLVLDCIGPVLAAAGLDENSSLDVGRFLTALEELLADAGVAEAVACHHMGHVAERSRGASRLRDWPDAEWKLVYEIADGEQDAGPSDRRYFSAAGRDVAEPEQLLDYDAASRRLSIAGGTRRDEKKAAYLAAIIAYITSHPEAECSKSRVEQAVEGRAADIRKTLAEAVAEAGPLCVHDGPRSARLHRIRATCTEHGSTPSHPVQGVLGTEFTTPSRPIGRDGVLNSAPGQGHEQEQRDGVEA